MATRQELKDMAKAIEVITKIRESAVVNESKLVERALDKVELEWRRYMDSHKPAPRRPAKRKAGA